MYGTNLGFADCTGEESVGFSVVTGQKVPVEKSLVRVITLVQGYVLMIEFVIDVTDRSGTRVQIRQIPRE